MKHLLFLSLILLSLAACGPIVREVDYTPAALVPEDAHPAPIKWSKMEFILPPGSHVGQEETDIFCWSSGDPVSRTVLLKELEGDEKYIRQSFHDILEGSGYDVVESLALIDEEAEDDAQRAEYTITAKIVDVDSDMCKTPAEDYYLWSRPNKGERGEMYVAIDWTIWDPIKRSTALKLRTEGYTKRRLPNAEGVKLMFQDSFEMAVHNLGADSGFYDLIVNGVRPASAVRETEEDSRPRHFDAQEDVVLPPQTLSQRPFGPWAEEGRKVAVMVQKIGHGSGFFITKQGHILTSFDAVGDALRTRIVTEGRKHKLSAEVLRVDKARNVALLKLEEIPENFTITTLPIRAEWPKVGEDVYAIGVPKDWKYMTDTLTKGIVSAHRRNYKLYGIRNDFIQADVEIHKGSTGGPLLDNNGNIVGMAQGSYEEEDIKHGIGLNHFIPIGEVLERLDILPP